MGDGVKMGKKLTEQKAPDNLSELRREVDLEYSICSSVVQSWSDGIVSSPFVIAGRELHVVSGLSLLAYGDTRHGKLLPVCSY